MQYDFTGVCRVTMDHQKGSPTSQHISTDFLLEVCPELDTANYLDKDDMPTKDGSKLLTQAFVQGLIGNIHLAHEKGYRDSAEHLRYIMAELQRGFASVVKVEEGTFKR